MSKPTFETNLAREARNWLRAFAKRRGGPESEEQTQKYLNWLLKKYEREQAAKAVMIGERTEDPDTEAIADNRTLEALRTQKARVKGQIATFNESVRGRQRRYRVELPEGSHTLEVVAQAPWAKSLLEAFFTKPVRMVTSGLVSVKVELPLRARLKEELGPTHAMIMGTIAQQTHLDWVARPEAVIAFLTTRFFERNGVETEWADGTSPESADVHEVVCGIGEDNDRLIQLLSKRRFRLTRSGINDVESRGRYRDTHRRRYALISRLEWMDGGLALLIGAPNGRTLESLARVLLDEEFIQALLETLAATHRPSVALPTEFPEQFEIVLGFDSDEGAAPGKYRLHDVVRGISVVDYHEGAWVKGKGTPKTIRKKGR